jgi:hypothetical protein
VTGENPLNRWHVSRTINIGHLLTTAVILVTVMLFFSKQVARQVGSRAEELSELMRRAEAPQ